MANKKNKEKPNIWYDGISPMNNSGGPICMHIPKGNHYVFLQPHMDVVGQTNGINLLYGILILDKDETNLRTKIKIFEDSIDKHLSTEILYANNNLTIVPDKMGSCLRIYEKYIDIENTKTHMPEDKYKFRVDELLKKFYSKAIFN